MRSYVKEGVSMLRSLRIFLLVAFAGCLVAEAGQAGDPIAGIWRGTHTAGEKGYEHSIVGKTDMNNKGVTGAHKQAVSQNRKAELIVHPGGYTWGRPEDHEAAIRWLEKETAK